MVTDRHNAVWSSKTAQAEIKVWADGGCIYSQRPVEPTVEQATYEPTAWDEATELECAWQVRVNGKLDGTLRFGA